MEHANMFLELSTKWALVCYAAAILISILGWTYPILIAYAFGALLVFSIILTANGQ